MKGSFNMSIVQKIALVLVIIGAINWGLVGFFQYDLVSDLFGGSDSLFARIIFGLVGIAGLVSIASLFIPDRRLEVKPQ